MQADPAKILRIFAVGVSIGPIYTQPGGWVSRGLDMASWLLFYLVGFIPAFMVIGVIAFRRRASHGMGLSAVTALTVFSGLIWPLLAVAALQVVVLVVPVKALRAVQSLGGHVVPPVAEHKLTSVEPVDTQMSVSLEQAAA